MIDSPAVTATYAVKTAVQLFVAASASHSFHGNSHSSFSRGVAMRHGVRSFAYDCAASGSSRNGGDGDQGGDCYLGGVGIPQL